MININRFQITPHFTFLFGLDQDPPCMTHKVNLSAVLDGVAITKF